MIMNLTYAYLTKRLGDKSQDGYYSKLHVPVSPTERTEKLVRALTDKAPDFRLQLFACFLCAEVLKTPIGDSIKELDSLNTYTGLPADGSLPVVYDMLPCIADLQSHAYLLDDDLRKRLDPFDVMLNIALFIVQILRNNP